MKKYMLLGTVVLLLLLSFCSCTNKENGNNEAAKTADMNVLIENMTKAAGTLPDMTTYTSSETDAESTFDYLCELDYSKINSFIITYSSEASAEELFLMELKDAKDIDAAKLALQKRIKTRRTAFNTYLPAEVSKIDKAQITSYGKYISLIICPTPQSATDAFQDYFKH